MQYSIQSVSVLTEPENKTRKGMTGCSAFLPNLANMTYYLKTILKFWTAILVNLPKDASPTMSIPTWKGNVRSCILFSK